MVIPKCIKRICLFFCSQRNLLAFAGDRWCSWCWCCYCRCYCWLLLLVYESIWSVQLRYPFAFSCSTCQTHIYVYLGVCISNSILFLFVVSRQFLNHPFPFIYVIRQIPKKCIYGVSLTSIDSLQYFQSFASFCSGTLLLSLSCSLTHTHTSYSLALALYRPFVCFFLWLSTHINEIKHVSFISSAAHFQNSSNDAILNFSHLIHPKSK